MGEGTLREKVNEQRSLARNEEKKMNEVEKAQGRYNVALKRIQSGLDARNGGPGAEVELMLAYQDLVRLGVATQLKGKYRHGKALKQVR